MGQIHEGAQVLVVAQDTRAISSISSPNIGELAYSEAYEHVTLPNFSGDAQLRAKQVWHGLAAEAFRVAQERVPRDQIIKSMVDAMEARYPGAKMASDLHIDDDQENNVLSIETTYTVPKLAVEREGNGDGAEERNLAETWNEPEPLIGGTVDLGALATEFLILGLDPYPRKPGATFQPPGNASSDEGPFAALGKLKKG